MGYIFEKRLNMSQAYFTRLEMGNAIKEGKSFNRYQRDMITAGTSYKRLDMLADWNRGRVAETTKRAVGRDHALRWYDKIALPYMKEHKITPTKFMHWSSHGQVGTFPTVEEEDEWDEYLDMKEEEFPEQYERRG